MKLVLFILVAFLGSCIKAPKLKQGLGPEASEAEMERVISKALYGIDPFSAEIGQQVMYYINARIDNQEESRGIAALTQTILGLTITSAPPENGVTEETLRLTVDTYEVDLQNGTVDRTEGSQEYLRRIVSGNSQPLSLRSRLEKHLSPQHVMAVNFAPQDGREVKRVSYHNLRESTGVRPPPADVAAKANCGDVPGCQMRYFQVDYDEAKWFSDSEYELEQWHFVISRDAPFLAYILERCLGKMYPNNGTNFFVKQCQFARDFSYRGASAP